MNSAGRLGESEDGDLVILNGENPVNLKSGCRRSFPAGVVASDGFGLLAVAAAIGLLGPR